MAMSPPQKQIFESIHNTASTPRTIAQSTGLSRATVQKHLKELLDDRYIERIGTPPRVHYRSVEGLSPLIHEHFMYKEVTGKVFRGMDGFGVWLRKHHPDISYAEAVRMYEEGYAEHLSGKKGDVFVITSGIEALRPHTEIYIDELYSIDLYTHKFGSVRKRTKTAVLLEMVKNRNNKNAKKDTIDLVDMTAGKIAHHIRERKISCIAFVPPTARRAVQIMTELKNEVTALCPRVTCLQIQRHRSSDIIQEQKTIPSVAGRLENAEVSFSVVSHDPCDTVLLIDDLVGSGATLNTIARKIRDGGHHGTISAIALVGVASKQFPVVKRM